MNNYPKHVGDYIRDTVGLSMLEDGAYNRMLDQYYAREVPLPLDERELYRLCRAVSKPERVAVQYVLTTFFERRDDGWHQRRADRELVEYLDKSDAARRSAAVRWHAVGEANAMRTHSEGNASQEPIASKSKATSKAESSARGAPAALGTRLPSDWIPPEDWLVWGMKERGWSRSQVEHVAVKFRNHWTGLGGKAARKINWSATWRNWVWGELMRGHMNGQHEPTLTEKRVSKMDRITGKAGHEQTIEGVANRVGEQTVLPIPGDLRKPGDNDVGRR